MEDERPVQLELGKDFDQVVIGVSIAELKNIAQDLMIASPALAASVERVQTVQTQACQLWLHEPTEALGWQSPEGVDEGPVLGAFYEPIDTWADMSDLIPRETWPAGNRPKSIAYFCGPLIDADPIPPYGDHAFPSVELARYREMVLPFLQTKIRR